MQTQPVRACGRDRRLEVRPELTELTRIRSLAQLAAEEFGLPSREAHEFKLAASEAAANAIEHGLPCGDGLIHVWVSLGAERLSFGVRNRGTFGPRKANAGEFDERGRGLTLIATVMDELTVTSADRCPPCGAG